MKTTRHIKVPTGDILVVQGDHGLLELLSLGDYGKDVNIKCNALGLTREPQKVRHTKLMPLEEKWVITISTQYGCSMGCTFCDVPKVGPGKNATYDDLVNQVLAGIALHPEVESTKRLNVHFARMGEPTWNTAVFDAAYWMKKNLDPKYKVHPVVSTMMPRNNKSLGTFLSMWMSIKNDIYEGNAGLQLSINSTNPITRMADFHNNALDLVDIGHMMKHYKPKGRKITLNFAVANYEVDPDILLRAGFDPDRFIIKLTPMHKTQTALENGLKTEGDYTTYYPYEELEEKLVAAGYDVLVFIASEEEDASRITCGNAILSGTMPECDYEEI